MENHLNLIILINHKLQHKHSLRGKDANVRALTYPKGCDEHTVSRLSAESVWAPLPHIFLESFKPPRANIIPEYSLYKEVVTGFQGVQSVEFDNNIQ